MGVEIERKFKVYHEKWQQLQKNEGELYIQGYITTDAHKTIRVRVTSEKAYFTLKGISHGAVRKEFEYEIPQADAQELLEHFASAQLHKIRHKVVVSGKIWEVDVFKGDNEGLIIAEIELTDVGEDFEIPDWVSEEVTGQEKYYNSNLTLKPYKSWA
ncbi:MAG TPA: CYTH domain-containing protein [Cytophagales bacterium]|nr:CYTH domain-containing protein [Cytophagales bacterium]